MFAPEPFLEIDVDTKKVRIVDNTDLSSINFTKTTAIGLGTITDPSGTPVVTGLQVLKSAGNSSSAWVDLPLDSLGEIVNTVYTLSYSYQFTATSVLVLSVTGTNTYNVEDVDWSQILASGDDISVAGSAISGNNGTKLINGVTFGAGNSAVEIQSELTNEAPSSARITFDILTWTLSESNFTYSGCDEVVLDVSFDYDCNTTRYGTALVKDLSVLPSGQTLVSRLLRLSYPPDLQNPATPSPITTTEPSIGITNLATGPFTYRLEYEVSVTQADGLIYTYTTTTGAVSKTVTCVGTLCDAAACIQTIVDKHIQAVGTTGGRSGYEGFLISINSLYSLATIYQTCGDYAKMRASVEEIYRLLESVGGCTCGCSGTDEANHWIDNAAAPGVDPFAEMQAEIDALWLAVEQLQKNVYPIKSAVAIVMSEFADYGLDAVAIPAVLFNAGCYLKISFAAGRSAPYTGANVVSIINVTTGESVGSITIDEESFMVGEIIVNLYKNTDTTFSYVQNGTKINAANVVTLYGLQNPLASDVFLENTNQVLAFSASDDRIGNYFQSLEIVGYKTA